MKAVVYKTFGAPDVLKLVQHPLPQRSAGELLVKVKSTSVNPVDYKTRNGSIPIAKKNKVMPIQTSIPLLACQALAVRTQVETICRHIFAHACRSLAVILRESSNQLTLILRCKVVTLLLLSAECRLIFLIWLAAGERRQGIWAVSRLYLHLTMGCAPINRTYVSGKSCLAS